MIAGFEDYGISGGLALLPALGPSSKDLSSYRHRFRYQVRPSVFRTSRWIIGEHIRFRYGHFVPILGRNGEISKDAFAQEHP